MFRKALEKIKRRDPAGNYLNASGEYVERFRNMSGAAFVVFLVVGSMIYDQLYGDKKFRVPKFDGRSGVN